MTPEASAASGESGSRSAAELVFAATLVAVALAAVWQASRYPAESAAYPIVIALGVAALGLWIGLREALRRRRNQPTSGAFAENNKRLATGVAALILYAGAVSVIGFILPSLIVGVALPAAVGFKRYGLSFAVAASSVLFILLVFVVALERPIPPDILAPLRSLLR